MKLSCAHGYPFYQQINSERPGLAVPLALDAGLPNHGFGARQAATRTETSRTCSRANRMVPSTTSTATLCTMIDG